MTDLNILASALAHKLPYPVREQAEAVIREAIEKTIDAAKDLADKRWEVAILGRALHNMSKQYVEGLQDASRQISEAIDSLKQPERALVRDN